MFDFLFDVVLACATQNETELIMLAHLLKKEMEENELASGES